MKVKIDREILNLLRIYAESIGVNIKVIAYSHITKTATLTFIDTPTEIQKQQIRDQIPTLIQEYKLEGIDDFDSLLSTVTPVQIDTYIDNNVTNLAEAKVFLKRLSRAVLFLYKKL